MNAPLRLMLAVAVALSVVGSATPVAAQRGQTLAQGERPRDTKQTKEAQKQLESVRAEVETASDELGAKGQELADVQAELEQLADEADAELAKARRRTATARDRADAQSARADLAEACLGAVATVLQDLYASDNLEDQLDQAAQELKAIAAECA